MAKVRPRILEKDYLALKQCRHGTFVFNKFDSFIGRSLDLYGEWCEAEVALLSKLIGPGSKVVDVGANIGSHTVPLASRVADTGLVIAFEPQRLVFQQLCANIALNCLTNVFCLPHAVGAKPGMAMIPVVKPRQAFNFGGIKLGEGGQGEGVAVTSIDSLKLEACNLIKIDVEGMEAAVLEGAQETIARCRPALFVENNTTEGATAIIAAVEKLAGYRAWWHIASYYNPANFFANRQNIFEEYTPEANMICLHESAGLKVAGLPEVIGVGDNWQRAKARSPDVLSAATDVQFQRA